jgi:hypothetical protein
MDDGAAHGVRAYRFGIFDATRVLWPTLRTDRQSRPAAGQPSCGRSNFVLSTIDDVVFSMPGSWPMRSSSASISPVV